MQIFPDSMSLLFGMWEFQKMQAKARTQTIPGQKPMHDLCNGGKILWSTEPEKLRWIFRMLSRSMESHLHTEQDATSVFSVKLLFYFRPVPASVFHSHWDSSLLRKNRKIFRSAPAALTVSIRPIRANYCHLPYVLKFILQLSFSSGNYSGCISWLRDSALFLQKICIVTDKI